MAKEKFPVLQIDAWSGEDGGWIWKSWSTIKTVGFLPKTAQEFFKIIGAEPAKTSDYKVRDDGYNIVLYRKGDGMPFYAVEYGSDFF
jgi:hypothetical protein